MSKTLYAAYGSNINVDQMHFRCKDAAIFGRGKLIGYQLEFCKVANVFKKDGAYAPVLLWELSEEDEKKLDKFEGVPHKYHKEYLDVSVGNDRYKALVYVINGSPHLEPPLESYYERIADGYAEAGFPIKLLEQADERAIAYLDKKYQSYGILDIDYQQNVQTHNSKVKKSEEKKLIDAFTLGQVFERYTFEDVSENEKLLILKSICRAFEQSDYKNFEEFATDYFEVLYNPDSWIAEQKETDYLRYGAYGSNMDVEMMKKRCPKSKLVGVAELPGYELKFCGCATVKEQEQAKTPLLLWDIHPDDWQALDMYEGYPSYYRKERVLVNNSGQKDEAVVYVMNCSDNSYRPPSPAYYKILKDAYTHFNINLAPLEDALKKSSAQKIKSERKGKKL